MYLRRHKTLIGLALVIWALSCPAALAAEPRAITDISASRQDDTTTVSISVSEPPIAFYAYKESPQRLVIELADIAPGDGEPALSVGDGLVTAINRQAAAIRGGEGTRVEVELAAEATHQIERLDSRLLVRLTGGAVANGHGAGESPEDARPQAATGPAPEAAQEEQGPQAAGLMTTQTESAPGSPCRIRALEFKCLPNGKCRVVVGATAKVGYELARVSRDTLLLTLRQASLPPELSRPLDTSQFPTAAIDAVTPRQAGRHVVLSLRFRQVVPYHLMQEGNGLVLEFDAAQASPSPLVTLAGRGPDQGEEAAPEPQAVAAEPGAQAEVVPAKLDLMDEPSMPGAIKVIYPGMQRNFTGQRISLDFQNADVHNVLRLIAEVSGLNIITSDDVKGRVTMRLMKIPWDQALDIVLATSNLAMSRTGNVIRVAPAERFRQEQKQAEEAAQSALDAMRKKEQLVPLVTEKIRVNYAKADAMKERVSDVLSSRGKATFDERTNIVIVRDTAEHVATARQLIESLDWPTPQVMIEARIVEATTTFSRELGTQWGAQFTETYGAVDGTVGVRGQSGVTGTPSNVPFIVNLPTSTTFGGLGFTFAKLSGALNIDARLLASEQQGKLNIISAPRISTLDNTEAYIQQGEDIPYLAQSVDGISTQFVQTALKLTVTPHITPDGRVRMKIKAEKSEPSDRIVNGTPGILRKETLTEVLVNHGETVVIGGILKDTNRVTNNRIPFFHRVPIFGWLFKSQLKSTDKQELLIFITPKIVAMEKTPQQVI